MYILVSGGQHFTLHRYVQNSVFSTEWNLKTTCSIKNPKWSFTFNKYKNLHGCPTARCHRVFSSQLFPWQKRGKFLSIHKTCVTSWLWKKMTPTKKYNPCLTRSPYQIRDILKCIHQFLLCEQMFVTINYTFRKENSSYHGRLNDVWNSYAVITYGSVHEFS